MLKRTISVLSKAAALPSVRFDVGSILVNNLQKRTFSSVWKVHAYQSRNLTLLRKCTFASQPSHSKMAMPALSPTMEQGNIIKWNFKEGDKVEVGQAVCDIETDKATLGFELQDAGYVAKILVPEGTKGVKVGTTIFILVDEPGDVKAFADYKGESASEQPQQTKQAEPKEKEQPKQPKEQEQKAPAKTTAHHVSENIRGHHRDNVRIRFTHGRGNQGAESHGHAGHAGERVLASPFARKIAREKGVDLSQVSGSGPHGRILAHDVQSFTPKPAVKETAEKAAPTAAPKEKAAPAPVTGVQNPYTDIQLSNVREIIAKRLVQSKMTIPHYYLKMEITMDNAIEIREKLNKESKHKISFNDMFIKAASLACVAVPEVNSQWHDSFIRKFKNADVSMAVDTGSGLITPIVFAANTKGLSEIANTTKQLIEKAKSNTLKPQEFQGGTFSISNLGMLGISRFSAVINPPQSCILAVGKTGKKLVDQGGIKEVNVMEVVLSCDHRVVDGAVGARWLQAFKNYLEKPLTMLL